MKYYTYIYCRTLNVDFRTICYPFCVDFNESKRPIIENFVKHVMNTETSSNGPINESRHAFLYCEEFILWGIAVSNDMIKIDQQVIKDCTGRNLRTFIGMLIPMNEFKHTTSMPSSVNFFTKLFNTIVVPIWDFPDNNRSRMVIDSKLEEYYTSDEIIELRSKVIVNNDKNSCKFYSHDNINDLLCSLKDCKTNIVTGLNVESHVINAANRFYVNFNNAICADTQENHIVKLVTIPNVNNDFIKDKGFQSQKNPSEEMTASPKNDHGFFDGFKSGLKNFCKKPNVEVVIQPESHSIPTERSEYIQKSLEPKKDTNKPEGIANNDSLMDWGSNWGDERTKNNIDTIIKKEEVKKNNPISLMDESRAAIDAYNAKDKEADEDIIQLRALLIKVKSKKNKFEETTLTLINRLIDVL